MRLFGLTGGVGMGKTTAAIFFQQQRVWVVDTDEIARELVQPGQPAQAEIRRHFGPAVFSAPGELNRAALARLVFASEAERKKLEAILHPRIRAAWQAQVETWRQEKCTMALVVIPLLFETQAENHFDRIICVACSAASQRARLLQRGWTPEQIQQRIAAQLPVEQKIARSHFVIWTEGALAVWSRQVENIMVSTAPVAA